MKCELKWKESLFGQAFISLHDTSISFSFWINLEATYEDSRATKWEQPPSPSVWKICQIHIVLIMSKKYIFLALNNWNFRIYLLLQKSRICPNIHKYIHLHLIYRTYIGQRVGSDIELYTCLTLKTKFFLLYYTASNNVKIAILWWHRIHVVYKLRIN